MSSYNLKAKVRDISKQLKSKNDYSTVNLPNLEIDINNIQQFNPSLLPEYTLLKLKQLKDNFKITSDKMSRLNQIIQILDKVLLKKANQISDVIVKESEKLFIEYNNIYSEIQDYNKIYYDIRGKINDILSVNGSEISDFIEINNDMGNTFKNISRTTLNKIQVDCYEDDFM